MQVSALCVWTCRLPSPFPSPLIHLHSLPSIPFPSLPFPSPPCPSPSHADIDALAAGGMKLTQFYSAYPICTPSRSGLLTGTSQPTLGGGGGRESLSNGTSNTVKPSNRVVTVLVAVHGTLVCTHKVNGTIQPPV